MINETLSHHNYDADDIYWYCTWTQLSRSDQKQYPATQELQTQLPQFCAKLVGNPLLHWALHKRLLNIQTSINHVEWLLISSLLAQVEIKADRVHAGEEGYVNYDPHYQALLTTLAKRIEKIQTQLSAYQQANFRSYFRFFNITYKSLVQQRHILSLVYSYLAAHLSSWQKLNQPWREAYFNGHKAKFNTYFAIDRPIWLVQIDKLKALFTDIKSEQLNALITEYKQKIAVTHQAIAVIYQVGSNESMVQNPNYRMLLKAEYKAPYIGYVELLHNLTLAIPKLTAKINPKNARQFNDVSDKLSNLRLTLDEQITRFKEANRLPKLMRGLPYLHQLASILQDLTDYFVKALVVDKDVLRQVILNLLDYINPEHENLKTTGYAYRLIVASLSLLALREIIKHCGAGFMNEQQQKQLFAQIHDQLDALRLIMFIQQQQES